MATLIGTVSKVVGQVFAVSADGARRALVEGDRLFAGEQLVTGTEGAVAVHLHNGQELTLGRDSSLNMTSQILVHQAPHVEASELAAPSDAQLTDVEQLQQAIAAGADPSQTGEATAAGPATTGAPGVLGGGHSFVLLQEVAGRVDPIIGFPTAGFNQVPEFVAERIAPVLEEHTNVPPPPVNHEVTLTGLSVEGGELTLNEANLPQGSASSPGALTQTGTFKVSAPDGLLSLKVGDLNLVVGGVPADLPQSITSDHGKLTITGFNPLTGVVSYSYTLSSHESHPSGEGANSLSEHFSVVAKDVNGDSASNSLDINVIDDLPQATPDSTAVAEGGSVSLNVLLNDHTYADGPATDGAVVGVRAGSNTTSSAVGGLDTKIFGDYGYLTLSAAGEAVYHSNPNSVSPPGATDVFTYTIRDADGDESTTTVTVNVADCNLKALDQDVTVYENALDTVQDAHDLAAATVTGSDPGSSAESAPGTLVGSVSGGSGELTYSLVGDDTGAFGKIQINADGTYTYTLTSAPKTLPNANDGPNTLHSENFTYQATDAFGNSTTGTIKVNIVDDVPKAVAAERSVTAAGVDSNVLLVIDVSGSMAEDSGVEGLSRLALAKRAIGDLLDKYDQLGDVKVQIVTFSDNATDKTAVWVDIATAKSIINGLNANGDTNYNAAVTTAQTAFNTSGKISGAQNIGYFFSDGLPNAGNANEANWKAFLDANGINNYAIGLGGAANSANLNPLAYDGSTHVDTDSVIVTNLNQLGSVLSGTVHGASLSGTLLGEGGSFGADGGFIKSILVDGTTYTYDPKGLGGEGSLSVSGGDNHGTFNSANNSLSLVTHNGGTLVVNLDTGDFTYSSQNTTGVQVTENIQYTVSDNDGDLADSSLVIKVVPNTPPVAADDHIITNLFSGTVTVPGELLLANDTDANGDRLSAAPTTLNTAWVGQGADFTGSGSKDFARHRNTSANQELSDVRSAFAGNAATMTAVLVVSGYLGKVSNANANDEDTISVSLKQGETLTLNHDLSADQIVMAYSFNGGAYTVIANDGTFTAAADGLYRIHIVNITDPSGANPTGSEHYDLSMTLNYAGGHDITPDAHGTYTAYDNHGGSDTAAVTISYQAGHTLTGTSGDDVLVAGAGDNLINAGDGNDLLTAGSGNNSLHGEAGNDLLFSGIGNDLLDGGAGNDSASYAHATAGVTVDLGLLAAQDTLGAGTDTLTGIENLLGSNFNDNLSGDSNANIISGGLGNDLLSGGGGDDVLIGGLGNDTLAGGPGADSFQWLKDSSGHDLVSDFTPGIDKLDLSQLLQGESATSASLDDYLHFKVTGSGASLVTTIDVSALAGGAATQTIDLAGVDLASHYGVTPGAGGVIAGGADTATIINGMLNDHSLKVDTV